MIVLKNGILNVEDLKKEIMSFQEKSNTLDEYITPFLEENMSKQKSLEVCQVGKFLYNLNNGYKIHKLMEIPDFFITNEETFVGLEHETLQINELKEIEGSIKNLFKKAEILYKSQYPEDSFFCNIWYKHHSFPVKKRFSNEVIKEIVQIMHHYFYEGELLTNEYIESISFYKSKTHSFNPNPGGHYVEIIKNEDIIRAIQKKESKLENYRKNSNLKEQWLLIVVGCCEPSSFDFPDSENFNDLKIETNFNHIFLFHDFDNKIIMLK